MTPTLTPTLTLTLSSPAHPPNLNPNSKIVGWWTSPPEPYLCTLGVFWVFVPQKIPQPSSLVRKHTLTCNGNVYPYVLCQAVHLAILKVFHDLNQNQMPCSAIAYNKKSASTPPLFVYFRFCTTELKIELFLVQCFAPQSAKNSQRQRSISRVGRPIFIVWIQVLVQEPLRIVEYSLKHDANTVLYLNKSCDSNLKVAEHCYNAYSKANKMLGLVQRTIN